MQEEAGEGKDSLLERGLPRGAHANISSFGRCRHALHSALALNYDMKHGPSLSEAAQSCLDIQYGHPGSAAAAQAQQPLHRSLQG